MYKIADHQSAYLVPNIYTGKRLTDLSSFLLPLLIKNQRYLTMNPTVPVEHI